MRNKPDKFARLRAARESGRHADLSDEEETNIYDEVDEVTYREHKRKQLMNDDFIVDDNGEGYVDNGVDEWDDLNRPEYYSEDEEDKTSKRKPKKVAKVSKTAAISSFFAPDKATIPKTEVKQIPLASIDDILDDFEVPLKKIKTENARGAFASSTSRAKPSKALQFSFTTTTKRKPAVKQVVKKEIEVDIEDTSTDAMDLDDGESVSSETIASGQAPIPDVEDKNSQKQTSNSDSESDDDVVVRRRPRALAPVRTQKVNLTAVKAADLPQKENSYAAVSHTEKIELQDVLLGDLFRMFWLDYAEADLSLLLFGKVVTKEGNFVSGVVQINGMARELYVLPRKVRHVDGEPTDEPVNAMSVHEEITPILMQSYGLESIKAKAETKKYAFELPDVPKETEYLKVLLPFKTTKNRHLVMPSDLEGETFCRVFGTNANILESFVMQQNVMGPCWLEIKNADFSAIKNATHCQVEVAVPSASCVTPISNPPASPPLTMSSLSVQTMLNSKTNKQEAVCISLATYRNVPQDSAVDESIPPNEIVTLVRPVNGMGFAPGLQTLAQKSKINLKTLPSEALMLACLAALVKTADPDVLVGHRLENVALDVLVHRMHDLKVATWSAMGRRNRKAWPEKFGKGNGFNNNLLIREIFQGRLLCDIANELGQSLTPKCQSWDLPEMFQVVCLKTHAAMEVNFADPKYMEDASMFLIPVKENVTQALITTQIAFAIQILSLSKQLTNLAGNAWSHTLSGTRAGRNEYILLHEFKKNNYIVPDKEDKYHKNTNHQQEAKLESFEDDATTVTSNKKPKYQGGLVFEPEKGLHKNYILVMDFNSLYPSIIQEYNICFTTVERDAYNVTHDEERDLPTIPERDSEMGVLPRLLNTLVSRRREVKKLLKDPKISTSEKAQYDIKQQALKLTANSMYGCLGYVNSRFYAKPLAMLVTNKGREILMDTRQLAESIGLRVVYGDTDSVMIDTGVNSLQEAIKIGEEFKVQVNERYKLLEIDTDNVFKRLLLHAKKKYAAMNVSIDRKTGKEVAALEVKGLDMRRREYCPLSKEISTVVLELLLSDKDPESALSEIYTYLEDMSSKVRNNELPVDKYSINTRLSKDPTTYPHGKTMPPVQVALRLRSQGKVIKAGTVITYVVIANESEEASTPADRARAIQEVLPKRSEFKPDFDFYLEKQIHAPIERLMGRIEGVDMMRVVSSLGLDTRKYQMRLRNEEVDVAPLESNISDAERFRQASYFALQCKCGEKFRFGGIVFSKHYKVTFNGITCSKCDYTFAPIKVAAQLEYAIRKHLALYYAGWLVCDDAACGIKTRQISVYGKRCIGASGKAHGCKGIIRYKYSDKALYNQLLYFDAIFDVDKAKETKLRPIDLDSEEKLNDGQVKALAEQNRPIFEEYRAVVNNYLKDCGRRYVDMKTIFDFMS